MLININQNPRTYHIRLRRIDWDMIPQCFGIPLRKSRKKAYRNLITVYQGTAGQLYYLQIDLV